MKSLIRDIFILSFVLISVQIFAQISPGKLSNAHAHLEGISKCTDCHVLGEKETTSKCLECHSEIQNLVNQNRGYHASLEVKDKKCASCHNEHHGRKFQIVKFDSLNFKHELTSYLLEGKHSKIDCASCHTKALIKEKISQKKTNSFLGLGKDCFSCHEDVHQNTLTNNCISCHNQDHFKPAENFNHSKTNYVLEGKHAEVECEKCHKIETRSGKKFQQFANVAHNNCTNCHTDVHENRFGNDCVKCHNLNSFKVVKSINSFDHSQTDYPLKGAHIALDCKKCHLKSYTTELKHNYCSDCHKDYHEGQFNSIQKSDCSDCHSNIKFTPANYSIQQHNKTKFKLEGSHIAMPCFECHKKNDKWNFRIGGEKCTDCHTNTHEGYMDRKYRLDADCKNCHSITNWAQISFNHDETEFSLEGRHTELKCRDCHFKEINGIQKQQFKWNTNTCENCHEDIHVGQFNNGEINSCKRCHTSLNWEPTLFNHDGARFKLDGKHINLNCKECHKIDPLLKYRIYKFKDISCASCH